MKHENACPVLFEESSKRWVGRPATAASSCGRRLFEDPILGPATRVATASSNETAQSLADVGPLRTN
jgi:hypothetical protein